MSKMSELAGSLGDTVFASTNCCPTFDPSMNRLKGAGAHLLRLISLGGSGGGAGAGAGGGGVGGNSGCLITGVDTG